MTSTQPARPPQGAKKNLHPLRALTGSVRSGAPAASALALAPYFTMHLMVHVKQKVVAISCGEGTQPVRWLANVATARFDDMQGRSLGLPSGVRLEDGSVLSLTQTLVDAGLKDQQHVYIVFKALRGGGGAGPKLAADAAADEGDNF